MGARPYTPTTGRFLSIDPITGGNDNRYTYPPDPINKLDLDGQFALPLPLVPIALAYFSVVLVVSSPSYQKASAQVSA